MGSLPSPASGHVEQHLVQHVDLGLFPTGGRRRWVVSALQGGRVGRGGGAGVSARGAGARGGAGLAAGRRVATGAADCRAAGSRQLQGRAAT